MNDDQSITGQRLFVLRPYSADPASSRRKLLRLLLMIGVISFCAIFGFLYSLFSPFLMLLFTVPILLLAVLVTWALPESRTAPVQFLEWLFYGFVVTLVIWPNYLAIALPGLPWITLIRLTGFPLVIVLLLCVSISSSFRTKLGEALNATPALWKLLVAFVAIQFISIAFSHEPSQSIDKFVVAQMGWTAMFFASCYLFLKPGRVVRWAALLWLMAIAVGLIGLQEYQHSRVPWADHIPGFLKVNDESVQRGLAGTSRSATGQYRVQSTYGTSLGLAEYIALTMPFVLQFVVGSYRWYIKTAAAVSVPFLLLIVILSDSRLGVVGCLLTFLFYGLAWSVTQWRRNTRSIFGPAITLAYPMVFCAAIASTFVISRLRARVWGNGPQQASTNSRLVQYETGIPMVLHQPWGHGIGMGADTLGFVSTSGVETIDTYYLMVALEYGVLGFIVYYGMLLLTIYYAGKYALSVSPRDRDYSFLIPIAIALVNFFVIKSVFSQQDNHPLIFMMMGMVVALIHRIRSAGTQRPGA